MDQERKRDNTPIGENGRVGRGGPDEGGPRPQVYARLRAQAERRSPVLRTSDGARWFGWAVIAAIAGMIIVIAESANPW